MHIQQLLCVIPKRTSKILTHVLSTVDIPPTLQCRMCKLTIVCGENLVYDELLHKSKKPYIQEKNHALNAIQFTNNIISSAHANKNVDMRLISQKQHF